MSMTPLLNGQLPGVAAVLFLVAALLLQPGRVAGRRSGGLVRCSTGLAVAGAGLATLAVALPAAAWQLHRPLLLPAASCALCGFLAARARLRRTAGRNGGTGGCDAARATRTAVRLAALLDSPSGAAVSLVAHRLALRAGADAAEAEQIQAAALLYDVGRVGLPAALQDGGDRPDAAAQRRLRRVPAIGARLLGDGRSGLLDRAAEIALGHQECWDGSGYPRGLSGLQIPFAARVVAVAAVFDAVLDAPGGAFSRPPDAVARCLGHEAGRLLDPRLARILLDDLPGMMQLYGQARRTTAARRGDPVPDAQPAVGIPSAAVGVLDDAAGRFGRQAWPGFA